MTKTLLAILLLFFAFTLSTRAQNKVDVTIETIPMLKGNVPAYVVTIPEAGMEHLKKEWIKEIRQNTKFKIEEAGGEINIKQTQIKSVYDKPINIYSQIGVADSALKVYAVFEIDSAVFVLNDGNKTILNEKTNSAIRDFMRNFGVEEYRYTVGEKVEKEQKKMKTLNGELESMIDQVKIQNKNIAGKEQDIRNSQDGIKSLEKENELMLLAMDSKKQAISAISDKELIKEAKSQLKDLQRNKKSIEKKLEKNRKSIVGYQAEIEQYKRSIENLVKLQAEKKIEIQNQEEVVKAVSAKLDRIK